uniref:Acyl_transf_3 domain-containing protein n=1 Tax=Caenorhabditis tropicalis TaxID=1561998 RepID=A0A1I7V040_9PELO
MSDEKQEELVFCTTKSYQEEDDYTSLLIPTVKKKDHCSKKKRQDLQGIRGLAILSVLGFHFLPSLFPNGYLGVDQFFVLSGYLMCMLLCRTSKSPPFSLITEFYIKRLKRILPLYFLLIFCALLALYNFFPDTAYLTNVESAKKAMIFASNRASTRDEDYFSLLAIAIDIFTHTWSLSVEIQFYIIVPFFFIFGIKCVPDKYQNHYYGVLGMIVFNITQMKSKQSENMNEDSKSSVISMTKMAILLIMIGICLFPNELSAGFLRPYFTISTGILMLISENDMFLSSNLLTYIGDISYSLYIVHWPIYAYWKLELSNESTWNTYLLFAFLSSVLLAVLSYELFEKWYLKLSNKETFILCSILFILNLGAVHKDTVRETLSPPTISSRLDGLTGPIDFDEAERLNRLWTINDPKQQLAPSCEYEPGDGPYGYCRHKGLDTKNGKFKLMLFGNSWAANHARLFYEECGYQAKSIFQGSNEGCHPLYAAPIYKGCNETFATYAKRLEEEKPDYAFLISRSQDVGARMAPGVTRLEDDKYYKSMKRRTDLFMKSIKYKMFIFMQLPEIDRPKVVKIVEAIRSGANMTEFDKSFITNDLEMARIRYTKLLSECPRCVGIDYKPLFWNSTRGTYRFYDMENSGLSYINGAKHLTFHGLELVRPILRDVCKSL